MRHKRFYLFLYLIVISFMFFLVTWSFGSKHEMERPALRAVDNSVTKTLKEILNCNDKSLETNTEYHGEYIIFNNFVRAEKEYKCDESITLSTPADYRFLDNVVPLVDKWNGPISVALYAPGHDFFSSLECIAYLRQCSSVSELIRNYVSFHLFFEHDHIPNQIEPLIHVYKDKFDCSQKPPFEAKKDEEMYKNRQNLTYPINLARNIAKINSQTHLIFPSDIELYPTKNFSAKFLDFLRRNPQYIKKGSRNVFVLPVFEILEGHQVPNNKTELQKMIKDKSAILFHKKVCSLCHRIPNETQWMNKAETEGIDAFVSAKRHDRYRVWEPFFVCTPDEPLWDERFNWEGQSNKMVQAYHLCMLDYNFVILNNAFLVHKPGVKKKKIQNIKFLDQNAKNTKILKEIQRELKKLYGENKKCAAVYK